MLQLSVDPDTGKPFVDQIRQQITAHIYFGELRSGDRLPSVRELADQLGVAKSTAHRIYSELEEVGLLESRPGSGVFVASRPERMTLDRARFHLLLETLERARHLATSPAGLLAQLRRFTGAEQPAARFSMLSARETYEVIGEDLPLHVAQAIDWIPPREPLGDDAIRKVVASEYLITTYIHRSKGKKVSRQYSRPSIHLRLRPEVCDRLYRPLENGVKCLVFRDADLVNEVKRLVEAAYTPAALEQVWCLAIGDRDLEWACGQASDILVSPACRKAFQQRIGRPHEVIGGLTSPAFVEQLLYHMVFG